MKKQCSVEEITVMVPTVDTGGQSTEYEEDKALNKMEHH